jgi:hypothetical protein
VTNIVFSPGLQAPITLTNPTGALSVAGGLASVVAQHNPTPPQGSVGLVGAAVKLALGMSVTTGVATFGAPVPLVVSGIVTPRAPGSAAVSASGIAPTVVRTTQSNGINQTFPRVGYIGNGGDDTFGGSGMSGSWAYTTAAPGTTVYNAIQQLGSPDIHVIGASFEGWQHGSYNKQQLVSAIGGQGTYPILRNRSRPTLVFLYAIMESASTGAADNAYETFTSLVVANDWWTYTAPGAGGSILNTSNVNYQVINYAYQWGVASSECPVDSPVAGTVYGTLWNGFSCAQTAALYFSSALLTLNPQITAFQSLTNGAAPNAAGIMWDNFFLYPNGGGNYSATSASWDGVGLQSNTTPGAYPSGASSLLARGQYQCLAQMQSYLAQCNPGQTYYNFANFGNLANTVGSGDIQALTASALKNVFHGGVWENVFGVAGSSLQNFQTFAQVMTNYNFIMSFCQSPQLVCVHGQLPATDGSTTSVYTFNGVATTVTSGTAQEYQAMRLILCFTSMLQGYPTFGTDGGDWGKIRWYDEWGDDSLTQVNVKRGFLGQPTGPYITLSNGVLVRPFQNGYVFFNPWGNGSQTVTLAQMTSAFGVTSLTFLKGTQQPSINSGGSFSSHTFLDPDGLVVLNSTALTITNVTPLTPQGVVGTTYTKQMTAVGGSPPYSWSATVTPNTNSQVVFGSSGAFNFTPSVSETETIVFTVTDSAGNSYTSPPNTLVITGAATPAPTGFSGSLAPNSTFTVTGSGFGSLGPNIFLVDDFESSTPGQKIPLTGPVKGAWSGYNNGSVNYLASGVAHTGSVSMNVIDAAAVVNGSGNQGASNTFNLSLGGPQVEAFISFWQFNPNQQFVGEYGNSNVLGTAPAPGTYPTDSCFKQTWFQPAKNTITGPWDLCTPTYTGGTWQIEGASGAFDVNLGESFYSFSTWNRHSTWIRGAPNATGSQSTGFFQSLNSEKGMNTVQFGPASTNPLFKGGGTQFSWLNFPGYAAVAQNTQTPVYDDFYLALGSGCVARVELTDSPVYTSSKHATILLATSWSDGVVVSTVPRTGLDFTGQAYAYVWNASGIMNPNGIPV